MNGEPTKKSAVAIVTHVGRTTFHAQDVKKVKYMFMKGDPNFPKKNYEVGQKINLVWKLKRWFVIETA